MATLVLTTIGTALGGPIGGALGSLVGQSIDRGLFGPGMRKGPRLGDLSVQTSSYGSPIPRIYGTMRVAGTVIWATDLKEEEAIEGGGKGSPERLGYSYSVNLAVALSSRPISTVRRIWADGKLIRGAADDFKVRTGFRLALGGEDQEIDPLIASVEGIEDTPAYRGMALAIFEGLDLTEFGNRIPQLTFEVVAEEDPVPLSILLADVSRGCIEVSSSMPIAGYAAHGTSVADSLAGLVELSGVSLTERDGRLRNSADGVPLLIADPELGCDDEGPIRPKAERRRAPDTAMPAALAISYYDPERDFQAGQMSASSGNGGTKDIRIELPAVLTASEARQLVEASLSRGWQTADELSLRLPPSRMGLRPGDVIQLEGASRAWLIRSASIEGMAVVLEAIAAPVTTPPLPADPGRAVSEPDETVGRTELALFELPSDGDLPASAPQAFIAASNDGLWKSVPVELTLTGNPLPAVAIPRRAFVGRASTVLDPRSPMLLDEQSNVTIQLANDEQILLNADWDALVAGSNLALLGDELIQFGSAERLGPGVFRLSRLLRGRRGTEWAAAIHAIGDVFCLIDRTAIRSVELAGSATGAILNVVAHGIGDAAPLPQAVRQISGEAMRPPSACHLKLVRTSSGVTASWVRRSHRQWAWVDAVGDTVDDFPELYRLTVQGPSGQAVLETTSPLVTLNLPQLPGAIGEPVSFNVVTVGPVALSRPATATIIL